MSSLLVGVKLSGAVKHGLRFHHPQGAAKVTCLGFPMFQTNSFRSAAQQQGQVGLAHAPEREYTPEHIMQDLPETVLQPTVTKKPAVQHVENVLKRNGEAVVQKTLEPITEEIQTTSEPIIDAATIPAYHRGSKFDRVPYWQNIGRWKDITENQFLSYRWGVG
jgi:lysine 2,3-aminomutase